MKILERGIMPDGTKIQIEEWQEDYPFAVYAGTIAAYPKSKLSYEGQFTPKINKVCRFQFDFESEEEARDVFKNLINGKKTLRDLEEKLFNKEYTDCI